jgi:Tfp pilus assembly protein PilW
MPVNLRDESGTTLVELMVALMAGMAILAALTVAVLTTMHASARVTARVEATQRARIAMVKLMQELHSACIAPEIAPVKEGSTGTKLIFVHQTGSAVSPTPIKSVITYAAGNLTQADYAMTGGTSPNWTFSEQAGSTQTLLTNVAPIAPSSSVFSYYRYSNGTISSSAQSTPLSGTESELTVVVKVAISANPTTTPVKDPGADANVQDSATLRLTPPSFNEGSPSKPCQ